MRTFPSGCRGWMVTALSVALACDGGSASKTPDDIAADSALAADLALANRDTLLVDSIGEYRATDAAPESGSDDTSLVDADPPVPRAPVSPSVPPAPRPPSRAAATAVPAPPAASRPAPSPRRAAPSSAPDERAAGADPEAGPSRGGVAACNSATIADQQTCVRATLASTDMRLNRIYRALITEMRRQEGTNVGDKDPPSVQRLRVAQRSWLVYRDNECRRRGRGSEGPLWAKPRVRCLGEFSARRANELADNFSRLTGS